MEGLLSTVPVHGTSPTSDVRKSVFIQSLKLADLQTQLDRSQTLEANAERSVHCRDLGAGSSWPLGLVGASEESPGRSSAGRAAFALRSMDFFARNTQYLPRPPITVSSRFQRVDHPHRPGLGLGLTAALNLFRSVLPQHRA